MQSANKQVFEWPLNSPFQQLCGQDKMSDSCFPREWEGIWDHPRPRLLLPQRRKPHKDPIKVSSWRQNRVLSILVRSLSTGLTLWPSGLWQCDHDKDERQEESVSHVPGTGFRTSPGQVPRPSYQPYEMRMISVLFLRKQRCSEIRWLTGWSGVAAHSPPPRPPTPRTCAFLRRTAWEWQVLRSLWTNRQNIPTHRVKLSALPLLAPSVPVPSSLPLCATPPPLCSPSFESAGSPLHRYQWCHYSLSLTNRSVSGNSCSPFYISSTSHQRMKASIWMFLFTIKKELLFLF